MYKKCELSSAFIKKAKKQHNNKYDYSLIDYTNNKSKIKIICSEHGIFEQTPNTHLRSNGCYECYIENRKIGNEKFIERARKVHKNEYDYSLVEYKNNITKIKIICQEHGIFEQTPSNHLSGHKCVFCSGLNKKTTEQFINESKKVHGDIYNYSKVIYTKSKNNVVIICEKHGEFKQSAITHLRGSICPKCNDDNSRKSNEEFIEQCIKIHGNKYDYSKTKYFNSRTKVKIICKKHGGFEQVSGGHLNGKGCPVCKSSKGEKEIINWLMNNKFDFFKQKTFKDCYDKSKLRFDFYLPKQNVCIEYNGIQHYETVSNNFFGGEIGLKNRKKKDKIKVEYCRNNNIKLLIIKYDEDVFDILNQTLPVLDKKSNNCL